MLTLVLGLIQRSAAESGDIYVAKLWTEHLYKERWAFKAISSQEIENLAARKDEFDDFVIAATDSCMAEDESLEISQRRSQGSPNHERLAGRAVWGSSLARGGKECLQVGLFFGDFDRIKAIRPCVNFKQGIYPAHRIQEKWELLEIRGWPGKTLFLGNAVSLVDQRGELIWDFMKKEIQQAVLMFQESSNQESP